MAAIPRIKYVREVVNESQCTVCMLIGADHRETAMFVRGFVAGMQRITHARRERFCVLHGLALDEALAGEIGNGVDVFERDSLR
jgi:hypothetical protein